MNADIAGTIFGGVIVLSMQLFYECKLQKKTLRGVIPRAFSVTLAGMAIGYILCHHIPPLV